MHLDRYIHPEFGCLAPTPRLRRELRIAVFSMLFGLGIGVVAVVAVYAVNVGGRAPDSRSVSPVVAHDAVAAHSVPSQVPAGGEDHKRLEAVRISADRGTTQEVDASKPNASAGDIGNADRNAKTVCEENNLACLNEVRSVAKPRGVAPRAANDGPPIARLPLGRSDASAGARITPRAPLVQGLPAPLVQGLPKLSPEGTTARTFQQDAAADRPNSTSQPRKKPQKSARQNPRRLGDGYHSREDRGNDWTRRDEGNRAVRLGRAYARDSSPSPKGFWAWSW
jgi:hypothetical protein